MSTPSVIVWEVAGLVLFRASSIHVEGMIRLPVTLGSWRGLVLLRMGSFRLVLGLRRSPIVGRLGVWLLGVLVLSVGRWCRVLFVRL